MCFLCYEALSIDPVAPLPKGLKQRSRWSCPKPCSAVPRAGALWMAEYCSVRGASQQLPELYKCPQGLVSFREEQNR